MSTMVRTVAGVQLPTRGPFHLEATVRVLQRRPSNRVDVWEHDRYRRMFWTGEHPTLIEVQNYGTIDHPDVHCSILSGNPSGEAAGVIGRMVRRVLGLDTDPARLAQLAETDRRLASTVFMLRGMRPPRFAELFESFASVIPFQQLSLDAGVSILGRLVERFGGRVEHGGTLYHAFPAAQAIARARLDRLRSCGLSASKAQTVRCVARAIDSGELTEAKISAMSTSDALRTLTRLPGIGPWSAALVLLRGLGRLDVFPPGDVGAERSLSALLSLDSNVSLDDAVGRFGDHRGYLYFCGLGGSLLQKRLIHAAPH